MSNDIAQLAASGRLLIYAGKDTVVIAVHKSNKTAPSYPADPSVEFVDPSETLLFSQQTGHGSPTGFRPYPLPHPIPVHAYAGKLPMLI